MKKYLFLFAFMLVALISYSQAQLINVLHGEFLFGSEMYMSSNGKHLVVGEHQYFIVYDFIGNEWVQRGDAFKGGGDNLIISDDGKTVIVGSFTTYVDAHSSNIKVYKYNGNKWIKKSEIISNVKGARFGNSISYSSNVNRIVIGSDCLGIDSVSGRVMVYDLVNNKFNIVGDSIYHDGYESFGNFVSISSDGKRIAILSTLFDNKRIIDIYEFNDSKWIQLGESIKHQSGSIEFSSDGNRLLCGAQLSRNTNIYSFDGSSWVKSGNNIIPKHVSSSCIATSCHLSKDQKHIILGFTWPTQKRVWVVVFDYINNRWIERKGSVFEKSIRETGSLNTAISADGNIFVIGHKSGGVQTFLNNMEIGRIPIKVFYDSNQNGIKEDFEHSLSLGYFDIDGFYKVYPNNEGEANLPYFSQTEITYQKPENFILTTENHYVVSAPLVQDTLFFGIAPVGTVIDVESYMVNSVLLCDRKANFSIFANNKGNVIQNVKVELEYTGEFINSIPEGEIIGTNKLSWEVNDILPGQAKKVFCAIKLPPAENLGDTLIYKLKTYIYDQNSTIIDTFDYTYSDILRCSYDPNDKLATPLGIGDENLTLKNQDIQYTIRFQNTGNYPAENIMIIDTLDENFDLSTFEFLNSSHIISEIDLKDNVLKFFFTGIFLADSVNSEPLSHGFISYKISPKQGLDDYSLVQNKAEIYFDYNNSVVTNTTVNSLVLSLGNDTDIEILDNNTPNLIYPNPNDGVLQILTDQSIDKLIVYTINGEKVVELISPNRKLDFSYLQSGIYLLKITIGEKSNTYKMIKSK